ncbi:MAG: polyphosphate:AMP phosphotransferase [Hyphomicrobiaceae bacterium]
MFEALQSEYVIEKDEFKAIVPELRDELIDAQLALLEKPKFPVVVLISGMDFPGRSAAARRLMSWMDPRHVRLYAHFWVREEELSHPRMWRFWRVLPPKGKIGLFLNSWYDGPVSNYLVGDLTEAQYRAQLHQIMSFERMLTEEGVVFLKFLFYLPKKENLENLRDVASDKITSWKLSDEDGRIARQFLKQYDRTVDVLEEVLSQTSTPFAPWIPLRSTDQRYRDITVSQRLVDALRRRMSFEGQEISPGGFNAYGSEHSHDVFDSLEMDQKLEKDDYKKRLKKMQRRVGKLTIADKFEKRGLVVIFEGNDAAGKGGCIRRLVAALDPRMINLASIAAPSDEERAQPYLWRFWRQIPEHGRIVIFDRSWYGRVLVERVEGFCSRSDWLRAYHEIRGFEEELSEHGLIVVKFWLTIDRSEQLRRFKARQETPYKQHKITEEDWRNRDKWDDYRVAVRDMVNRTSTSNAPWTLVAANDKRSARISVLETIAQRIEAEI